MTAETLKELLGQPIALLALMYLAALASAAQQISDSRQAGGEVYSLGEYLRFWPETIAVVVGNLLAFVVLVFSDQLNFASAVGIGYGSNFVVDKMRQGGRSDGIAATPYAERQAGFARPLVLGILLAIGAVGLVALPGCTSTREAYHEATSPNEYAYVVAEHYASIVHEAANLAENPATDPKVVAAMQKADAAVLPAIRRMNAAALAFAEIEDAKTEAELQLAIDNAVRLLADLLRIVQNAKAAP